MRARLIELHRRRALLTARAQSEREQLAVHLARAEVALAWIGRGRAALDELRRRPLLLGAAALLALVWRPRRILKLLASGWSVWQVYRRMLRWWARLGPLVDTETARRA